MTTPQQLAQDLATDLATIEVLIDQIADDPDLWNWSAGTLTDAGVGLIIAQLTADHVEHGHALLLAMQERLDRYVKSAGVEQLATLADQLSDEPDRAATSAAEWTCDAYAARPGEPEMPPEIGARCFAAPAHFRACRTLGECQTRMTAERRRVFDALRASDDPLWQGVRIDHPDQLLNGPRSHEGDQ